MIVIEGEKGSSDHFLFVGSSICSVLYGYIIIWFVYKLLLMGGNSTLCHVWILFVHIWCMNAMQQQQPQIASFFFSISMSAMWWTQRIFLTSCVLIEKPVETHILHLPCHFTTLSLFAVLIAGWRTACCQNHQRDIKKKKEKGQQQKHTHQMCMCSLGWRCTYARPTAYNRQSTDRKQVCKE